MSTQFTNRQWRLPNEENKSKVSNYSMDFDGSSQYIELNSSVLLPNQHTISTWIKSNDLTSSAIGYVFSTEPTIKGIGLDEGDGSFGAGKFYYWNGGGPTTVSTTAITVNNWHHIVFVFDSTANEIKFYLDGNLDKTTTVSIGTAVSLKIIGSYNGTINYLNGKLDAFSIFNYALSSSQVTTLYGSSSTGIGNPMSLSPKPVAYYPLGDQDAFNGADYLVPNSSLKDYVFDFDGSDKINCGTSSLGITNAITVSAWVKIPSTTPNSTQPIVCEEDSTIGNNWSLRYRGGGYNKYYFIAWNTNGNAVSAPSAGITPNVDEWQHVVGVYDGSSTGRSYVYVNGVWRGTSQPPTGSGINSTSSVAPSIGGFQDLSAFVGSISNVQVFNTVLPLTGTNSIQTLYNNGSPLVDMSGFTSLVSWWKLDASATYDSSTTTWTIPDDSTNSNDGTSSGMTQANLVQSDLSFTSGYSPYALDFDSASSDYIDCGNDSSLYPRTGNMSYSAWFNTSSIGVYQTIFGSASSTGQKGVSINLFGSEIRVFMAVAVGGQWGVNTGGIAGGNGLLTSGLGITTGNWYHITTTLDRVGDGVIYINGNEVLRASMNPNNYSSVDIVSTDSHFIGKEVSNFNGKISNVSVWNTELTSAQVTEIYNEGVPSNLNNHSAYSNLVSWWQLGSNTSWVDPYWIALDEKGTNNGQSQNVAAPNNMGESAIVDGVGSYANGVSSGMSDAIVGDAFGSSANSLSYNMDVLDRSTDVPN